MTETPEPGVTDPDRLQLEVELLGIEVEHLRARLTTLDALRESERSCREELATTRRRLKELRDRHDVVLRDMQRLVRRLSSSPAGPVVRRWKGFQVLLARYGGGSPK